MILYSDKEGNKYFRILPVKNLLRSTTLYEITMRGDWLVLNVANNQMTVKKPEDLFTSTDDEFKIKEKEKLNNSFKAGEAKEKLKRLKLMWAISDLLNKLEYYE